MALSLGREKVENGGTDIMNVPTINDWNNTLAMIDGLTIGIWALTIIVMTTVSYLHLPIKQLNISETTYTPITYWLVLLPIAALLRTPRLFTSFWYDEAFTGVIANLPIDRLFDAIKGDVHPPLYYLVAKVLGDIFGHSDITYRLPSYIAGIAFVIACYHLALGLTHNHRTAQLAGIIITLSPAMIHYSAEARYPMMLALSIIVSLLAIKKNRPALFAFSSIATIGLHAVGIVYAGIIMIVLLFFAVMSKTKLIHKLTLPIYALNSNKTYWTIAIVLIILSIGAMLALALSQTSDINNGFWLWYMLPVQHITEATISIMNPPYSILIYPVVVALSILAINKVIRSHDLLVIAVVIGVPLVLYTIGLIWKPIYLPRTMLTSSAIMMIFWAVIAQKYLSRYLMIAIALLPSLPLLYSQYDQTNSLRDLYSYCTGSDIIYATSTGQTISALHYGRGYRVVSWWNGDNQHQELPTDAKSAMGFDLTPIELQRGNICMVTQWSYYTTEQEHQHVNSLKKRHRPTTELLQIDAFIYIEINRWAQWATK